MTLTRPVVTPRIQWAYLWLLALVPGNGVVLFDLAHHAVRPAVWLARFVPSLLVLAVVAWAQLRQSPAALRLRKELRLAQSIGLLLLLTSGVGLWSDLLATSGSWGGLARTVPWMLLLVLPASMVMRLMTVEHERGTLADLLSSPLGARAFAEKFAVSAGLVVISWSQIVAAESADGELWWFAFFGHVLALATVPTWFFLMRKEGTTLGASILGPLMVVLPAAFFKNAVLTGASVAVYAALMLALLPRAVRRGVMAPSFDDQLSFGVGFAPRIMPPLFAAELNAQRDALALAVVGLIAFAGISQANAPSLPANGGSHMMSLFGGATEATMVLFMLCAMGAALSPGLAFSEAQRLGTLETLLTVRTRRAVFLFKALSSLAVTMVACGAVPVAATLIAGVHVTASSWCLGIAFVWSVGLVSAVHTTGAGHAMGAAVGLAVVGFFGLMTAFGAMLLVLGSMLGAGSSGGAFTAAVFAGAAGIAFVVAWRRFVLQPESPVRSALLGAGASLFHAAALGAAAAISGL